MPLSDLRALRLAGLFAALASLAGAPVAAQPAGDAAAAPPADTAAAPPAEAAPPAAPAAVASIADSQARFGAELLRLLAHKHPQGATALSPVGIAGVLAMAGLGGSAPARQAIAATLRLPPAEADGFAAVAAAMQAAAEPRLDTVLKLANAVFVNRADTPQAAFAEKLEQGFHISPQPVDFGAPQAAAEIDHWVAEATGGIIPHLGAELSASTQAVLASALYFKGKWTLPFPRAATADAAFHPAQGRAVKVPMMVLSGRIAYRESHDVQAVSLAYGSGDIHLLVLLPRAGLTLAAAGEHLVRDPGWLAGEGFHPARGTLHLPRFEAGLRTELLPALAGLGLKPALAADAFAGIATPAPGLSSVIQETRISVDEEGSEAAAVTAGLMERSADMTSFAMKCDRPFLFVLRQRSTGVLLLVGTVASL